MKNNFKKNILHFNKLSEVEDKELTEIEDYVDVIGDTEEVYNENEKEVH